MGISNSKNAQLPAGRVASKPSGKHTPLPRNIQAYQGPSLDTLLISVPVKMTNHFVSGFQAGQTATTSNVDKYYPMLAGYLEQGFTLNTFYKVPGAAAVAGFGAATLSYEAVFCRPVGAVPTAEPQSKTRLLIEKSNIYLEQFRGGILNPLTNLGTFADTSDILNKIYHHASLGGRLICIEGNGEIITQGASATMAGISCGNGIDVLFEIPVQPNPVRYVYQAINVPIGVRMQFASKITAHCDWLGIMASYLNQGWKLVEILFDQSQRRAGAFATEVSLNSVWFFEKEASQLDNTTPVYEGAVLEYLHKVSMGFGSVKVKTDWSAVITEMGRRGWELACIQETPEANPAGIGKIEMKLIMFFQRKIIGGPNVAPPPYPGVSVFVTTEPPQEFGHGTSNADKKEPQ